MISEVWTRVAEPYRSQFLSEVDPTVDNFIDNLVLAVHHHRGLDLSDANTFAAQSATVADLKSRFLDEQAGSYLDEMLHAARFCQAHQKFKHYTLSQLKSVNKVHAGSVLGDMAQRFSHLAEQTIKIATDNFVFAGEYKGEHARQGALGVLSYLEDGIKDNTLATISGPEDETKNKTLATIPSSDPTANGVEQENVPYEVTVAASVKDLCDAANAFYSYRHRFEIAERKEGWVPASATQSSRG